MQSFNGFRSVSEETGEYRVERIQSQRRRGYKPRTPTPHYVYICRTHVWNNLNPFCIFRFKYICTLGTMTWALSPWAGASMHITALRPGKRPSPSAYSIHCPRSLIRVAMQAYQPHGTVQNAARLTDTHRNPSERYLHKSRRHSARQNQQSTNNSQREPSPARTS